MWQAIAGWIDRRSRKTAERMIQETKAGGQIIRMVAHYQGRGPYSEYDLRAMLKKAQLDDRRVLPVMWELEDGGHAEKNLTFDGTVSWFVD